MESITNFISHTFGIEFIVVVGALSPFIVLFALLRTLKAWEDANFFRIQVLVLKTILAEHWKDIPVYHRKEVLARMERVGIDIHGREK